MQAIIMEQLSTNIQSNTKPFKCHHCGEKFGLFWLKIMFYRMGFLDAGYLQVSGADQVIFPITSNLRVPIR